MIEKLMLRLIGAGCLKLHNRLVEWQDANDPQGLPIAVKAGVEKAHIAMHVAMIGFAEALDEWDA